MNVKENINKIKKIINMTKQINRLYRIEKKIKLLKNTFEQVAVMKGIMNNNWEIIKCISNNEEESIQWYIDEIKKLRKEQDENIQNFSKLLEKYKNEEKDKENNNKQ